jgi:hypothetical protein
MNIETGYYDDEYGNEIEYEMWVEPSYELKVSMYLEYSVPSTNYTRTLTQGVKLTDNRKLAGVYRRTAVQTVKGTTALKRFEDLYRKCAMNVQNGMALKRAPVFIRKAAEQLKATMGIGNTRAINRTMPDQTAVQSGMTRRGDSKRAISNTNTPGTMLSRYAGIYKKLFTVGNAQDGLSRFLTFPRYIAETIKITGGPRIIRELLRRITLQAGNSGTTRPEIGYKRDIASPVEVSTTTTRHPVFLRTVLNAISTGDYSACSVVWLRRLPDEGTITDQNRHIGGYIRGLYTAAGSMAETDHAGDYHRRVEDTAHNEGVSLRHLFIFLRLVTLSLVRDYITGRFLKSKEELVIKFPVCREITLDSTLH